MKTAWMSKPRRRSRIDAAACGRGGRPHAWFSAGKTRRLEESKCERRARAGRHARNLKGKRPAGCQTEDTQRRGASRQRETARQSAVRAGVDDSGRDRGGHLLAGRLAVNGAPLVEPKNATLVGFSIGCIVALAVACFVTRDSVGQSAKEARRLIDALSWAAVLPQMLGMLGLAFADSGVGKAVAHVATAYVNLDYRFVAVAVYCVGMALFTMVMGNGFAAFPVMTGGIGDSRQCIPRQSRRDGGHRDVLGVLRHADDADGGELQHGARGAAGIAG